MDYTQLSNGSLVLLVSDGDDDAFAALVARCGPAMRRYVTYVGGRDLDADEVVQDALITAWNSIDTLANPDAVQSWLMRIAARKAIDAVRARRLHQPIDDIDVASAQPTPHEVLRTREKLDALREALDQLPEAQREVWVLREIGEMSYDEIAEHLDVTTATVRGRLARARATIAQEMEDWR